MKTISKYSISILVGLLFHQLSFAQESQVVDTARFNVSGVCDQCKSRIENAALMKGVKWVQWDQETHFLTVIYRSDKVDIISVHQAVANAGHDTEKVKTPDEVYNNLPRCCAYRDAVEEH